MIHRVIVLANSPDAAEALIRQPGAGFLSIQDLRDVGDFGLYVLGKHGLHNRSIARVSPINTKSIAWNLPSIDPANHYVTEVIQNGDPFAVVKASRVASWVPPAIRPETRDQNLFGSLNGPQLQHISAFDQAKREQRHTMSDKTRNAMMNLISTIARRLGVEPAFALAVADYESDFNPAAVSGAGAMGLFQLMPETAKTMRLKDPFDAHQNASAGIALLKIYLQRYNANAEQVLIAYHGGAGTLKHTLETGKVRASDQIYIREVEKRLAIYRRIAGDAIISEGP